MKIDKIVFENFRNLKTGELVADSGINVIYGENAQGKTNLLEAIWMFSGAKSFRGAKDASLIKKQADFAKLSLDFTSNGRQQTAQLTIKNGRSAQLNGIKLKTISELAGNFKAVVFSPTHLSFIKDGPAERRRFLDMAICQLWPKYIPLYQEYMRAVTQRNLVLKDAKFHTQLYDMLDAYEVEIAKKGSQIIAYRKKYIELIKKYAVEIYDGISGGKEKFGIEYITVENGENASFLLKALNENRKNDIFAGSTSIGPHRDDLLILISDMAARQFASQGQQRSAVLALKLAEAAVLKDIGGEQPVALLDDVMSELDIFRQDYILNHIKDWQVFITCCDASSASRLENGARFMMKDGVLTKE